MVSQSILRQVRKNKLGVFYKANAHIMRDGCTVGMDTIPNFGNAIYARELNGGNMKLWRIWAKALGDKAGANNNEADLIAVFRTGIVLIYIITNFFIVAGVIRHW